MGTFTSRFGTGDRVYLRNREENEPGIVVCVSFSVDGGHSYKVRWPTRREESDNYEAELSETHDPHYGTAE